MTMPPGAGWTSPMLATLGDPTWISERGAWALEVKWDGYRAIARIGPNGVGLFSRRGNDITATYPDLLEPLRTAVHAAEAILDGEILGLDAAGNPSFAALQTRAGLTRPVDVEKARAAVAVRMVVFDLLEVDGEDLRTAPFDERHRRLTGTVVPNGHVQVSDVLHGDVPALLAWSRGHGYEGLIAKRRSSPYQSGRRSRDWVKLKNRRAREVIVAGWVEGQRSLQGTVGALILAVPGEGGLRFAGRVGTGFTRTERDALRARFVPLATAEPAVHGVPAGLARRAQWLRPELLGEVTFAEATTSGLLRQPSWRGLRVDKTAADIDVDN